MESPCGAAAGERQGCSSTFYPPSNEFLMQIYMFFIKLTTNIKKKIDILLIFDVQGKKSLLAKEQRENIKNTADDGCLRRGILFQNVGNSKSNQMLFISTVNALLCVTGSTTSFRAPTNLSCSTSSNLIGTLGFPFQYSFIFFSQTSFGSQSGV